MISTVILSETGGELRADDRAIIGRSAIDFASQFTPRLLVLSHDPEEDRLVRLEPSICGFSSRTAARRPLAEDALHFR